MTFSTLQSLTLKPVTDSLKVAELTRFLLSASVALTVKTHIPSAPSSPLAGTPVLLRTRALESNCSQVGVDGLVVIPSAGVKEAVVARARVGAVSLSSVKAGKAGRLKACPATTA